MSAGSGVDAGPFGPRFGWLVTSAPGNRKTVFLRPVRDVHLVKRPAAHGDRCWLDFAPALKILFRVWRVILVSRARSGRVIELDRAVCDVDVIDGRHVNLQIAPIPRGAGCADRTPRPRLAGLRGGIRPQKRRLLGTKTTLSERRTSSCWQI